MILDRASPRRLVVLGVGWAAWLIHTCKVRVLTNRGRLLTRLRLAGINLTLVVLSLFELDMSGQTCAHLFISHILLLVRLRLLIDGQMRCTNRSVPLVVHRVGVRGRLYRCLRTSNGIIHCLLRGDAQALRLLSEVWADRVVLMAHKGVGLGDHGNGATLTNLRLIFIRILQQL